MMGVARKVVWVLTTNGADLFPAMTRISIASVKATNPQMIRVVICDGESMNRLEHSNDPIIHEVDNLVVADWIQGSAAFRNRYMKTSIRSLVDGPFLYLDGDTVVRGDLAPAFRLYLDFAAAPNNSRDRVEDQMWYGDVELIDRLGWKMPSDVFFNGGVAFFNDTREARQFGREWHRRWQISSEATGSYRDQPSLNATVADSAARIGVLPHLFNAQVRTNSRRARKAVVWHLCLSMGGPAHTEFEVLMRRLLDGEPLTESAVMEVARRSHPWRRRDVFDGWVAIWVLLRGRIGQPELDWFQGRRVQALKQLLRSLLAGLRSRGPFRSRSRPDCVDEANVTDLQ